MNSKSFDDKRIADGYAKDRPYLHPQVTEILRKDLKLNHILQNGLDIGCGAGLSAKALKSICNHVTGTDISPEMISAARKLCGTDGYSFYVSRAEEITGKIYGENINYDIVTAAGVINWVEQDAFLKNLHQIMNPDAYLVIYDFWITDRMCGTDTYTDWWHHTYLPKFPKPFRKENRWTNQEVAQYGFQIECQKEIDLTWDFDLDSFTRFMLIQSNVNEQIERGVISEKDAKDWLMQTLQPVFGGKIKTLLFHGYLWYIQSNE